MVLTERAAQRLGIETAPVTQSTNKGAARLAVPYGAVLYDADGATWAYTSPQPLTFVRHPITIETIQGDVALLTEGPPAGTQVVTVGVAELFGTEFQVGH